MEGSKELVTVAAAAAVGGLAALAVMNLRNQEPRAPAGYGPCPRRRHNGCEDTDDEARPSTPLSRNHRGRTDAITQVLEHPDWQGFSMEEAREHANAEAAKAAMRTPTEVLLDLQRGNARFWMGAATRPEVSAFERRALINLQYPSVAILGCSDSRVPIEIVFDHGLGDIFVIRVAGNCLDTTTGASLQYAVKHLRVKVVVVMGHEGCGALKAAVLPIADIEKEPPQLSKMLTMIKGGLDEKKIGSINDDRARDRETCVANVRQQLQTLTQDAEMMSKVKSDELLVVGAFYNISSGIVDFFDEISKDTDLSKLDFRGRSNSFRA